MAEPLTIRQLEQRIYDLNVQIAAAGNLSIRGGRINGCDPSEIRHKMQQDIDKLVQQLERMKVNHG